MLQSTFQQPCHGGDAFVHGGGDVGHGLTLEVVGFQRRPLGRRQGEDGLGQGQQPFMAIRRLAGRGSRRGQPLLQVRCRVLQSRVQRAFARHVTFGRPQPFDLVCQIAGQRLPQPGHLLAGLQAGHLGRVLVGLQQRLLHDAGQVNLAPPDGYHLLPGQQEQVGTKPVPIGLAWGYGVHGSKIINDKSAAARRGEWRFARRIS